MKSLNLQFKQFLLAILFIFSIYSVNHAQSCTTNPGSTVTFIPTAGNSTICNFTVELCIDITINNTNRVTFRNTITDPAGPTLTVVESGPFPIDTRVCTEFNYLLDCDIEPEFTATAIGQTGNGSGSTCDPQEFPPFGLFGPLPVELLYFTAQPNKAKISLNWATASELNNDYFDIERSTDGRTFQKIEQVKGAGTSDVILNYTYNDVTPTRGQNYYRLKQVDFDGAFVYTNIINAVFKGSEQLVKVMPTHSYDELNVVFYKEFDEKASIEIFDLIGNRVLTGYLPVGDNQVTFDVSSLDSGQYYIRTRGENEYITTPFIKVE